MRPQPQDSTPTDQHTQIGQGCAIVPSVSHATVSVCLCLCLCFCLCLCLCLCLCDCLCDCLCVSVCVAPRDYEPSPMELFAHATHFFGYKVVLLGRFNGQVTPSGAPVLATHPCAHTLHSCVYFCSTHPHARLRICACVCASELRWVICKGLHA